MRRRARAKNLQTHTVIVGAAIALALIFYLRWRTAPMRDSLLQLQQPPPAIGHSNTAGDGP